MTDQDFVGSLYETTGISVNVESPLWVANRGYFASFTEELDTYTHEIDVAVGFKSAQIKLRLGRQAAEQWLLEGLGRHIVVVDSDLTVVWEGFINSVSMTFGGLTVTRGPLLDIANRVIVMYSRVNEQGEPPLGGGTFETVAAEDLDSQARYGIIEKIVSIGQATLDEANLIRDSYLAEYAFPETTHRLSFSNLSDISITLECAGYGELLNAYVYNNYSTLFVTLDTKIQNILAADPNGVFSTDYAFIDENLSILQELEDQNRTALTIIKSVVDIGDINGGRWVFGIYEGRKAYYFAVPTAEIGYVSGLGFEELTLNAGANSVDPWKVRPGKWVVIPDFLASSTPSVTLRQDPRNVFIETVKFTAPHGLDITGNKVGTVAQLINRLGLGGL